MTSKQLQNLCQSIETILKYSCDDEGQAFSVLLASANVFASRLDISPEEYGNRCRAGLEESLAALDAHKKDRINRLEVLRAVVAEFFVSSEMDAARHLPMAGKLHDAAFWVDHPDFDFYKHHATVGKDKI